MREVDLLGFRGTSLRIKKLTPMFNLFRLQLTIHIAVGMTINRPIISSVMTCYCRDIEQSSGLRECRAETGTALNDIKASLLECGCKRVCATGQGHYRNWLCLYNPWSYVRRNR